MKLKSIASGIATSIAKPHNSVKRMHRMAKQKGFTLVELIIVIGVIGGIMSIIMPSIITPSTKTDSLLVDRVANSAKNSFDMLALSCGTSRKANTPLVADADAANVPALIFEGIVESEYEDCYAKAGVSPNARDVSKNADGDYLVNDAFTVTFEGGGAEAFEIHFADVPEEVANNIALSYNSDFDIDDASGAEVSVYGAGEAITRMTPLTLEGTGEELYTVTYRYVN